MDQITLGVNPLSQARPALLIALKSGPDVIPADAAHSSITLLTSAASEPYGCDRPSCADPQSPNALPEAECTPISEQRLPPS